MKKYVKYIIVIVIILVIALAAITANINKTSSSEENENFKIVTSFYPIYIMALNITDGAENIELVNMTETNVGCIHDYTLTTSDMKNVENANVFIENGLSLEDFIQKITSSNEDLKIIDSSEGITNLIYEEDEINPHIWTSISNYILQVENITEGLISANPENASIYEENSKAYIEKLENLKLRYETELNLEGKVALSLNESFAYLGEEIGLDLTVIETSHEESTLSAETLKDIINNLNENDGKIIIVDIEDDTKNAETIATETGAEIYVLNSALTGDLEKDAYINIMESNLEILKEM